MKLASRFFFGFIVLGSLGVIGYSSRPAENVHAYPITAEADTSGFTPRTAPPFELKDPNGKIVHWSDFAGKVVVINFFATWCPPCRKEIPQFNELQKKYGAQGVQFVGISLDEGGAEKVKAWTATHPVEYPILMADSEQKILDIYDVKTSIPVTFVIDRKGVIQHEYMWRHGETPGDMIEGMIKPLIGG